MRLTLATVLLVLCGCGSSRSKFPGEKIPCNSNSDCPSGSHCASNACRDDSDKTAPTLTSSKLSLIPAVTNTLRTVSALGVGTVGHYEFTASERLDRAPQLQSDQGILSCSAPLGDGTSFVSDCQLADALSLFTGDVAVSAQLFDLSLNQTTAQLPPVPVDSQPPDPPAVGVPGAVVHVRKPWGASLEDAGVTERVTFAPGALEAGAFVRITVPVTKAQVGTGTAAADGSLVVDLLPTDVPQLMVRAIDGAGNNSLTVSIADGRWAATMGQKVLGSTLENPHALALVPVFIASAEPNGSTEVTLDGPATATGGYTWSPRRYSSPISTEAFAVLDTTRSSALLYVGDVSAANQGGYYEWSGDEWVPLQAAAQSSWPQLHNGPCVAYDEGRRRAVLFGGTNALGARTDATFVFENGAWMPYAPVHSPPSRNHTTCFYSRALGGVVLFSGLRTNGIVNDEWLFGDDWVPLSPALKPAPREQAVTMRDTLGDRVVMVGGLFSDGGLAGDTWLFADGGWAQVPGALPMIDGGTGCYDMPNDRFLVKPFVDPQVYALSDAGWVPSEISSPLTFRALVSEPSSGTLLAVTNLGTFQLIGTTRSQLAQTNPVQFSGVTTRLAYDPQLGSVRAFVETDGGTLQDWVLARNGWSLTQTVPFAADVDDVGLDLNGAQWVLTASDGTSWVSPEGKADGGWQLSATSALTPIGMVNESGELWGTPGFDAGLVRWSGSGWSTVSTADTFALGNATSQDYGVGLEDGGALWLTTVGNGSAGVEFGHGQFFAGRVTGLDDAAGVVFEPNAHAPVLFGGKAGQGASDSVGVLLLQGTSPSLVLPRVVDPHGWSGPAPRMGAKLVFDAARQRTLMFGGNDTRASRFDDLFDFWELSGPGLTPAVVFHVALDAAQLPAGVTISQLTARFSAAGVGGVNAWLHTPTGWQPLATGSSTLSFTVSDARLLDALTTSQSKLTVAVTPAQTNGATGATVTLSDIEVELSYRYP